MRIAVPGEARFVVVDDGLIAARHGRALRMPDFKESRNGGQRVAAWLGPAVGGKGGGCALHRGGESIVSGPLENAAAEVDGPSVCGPALLEAREPRGGRKRARTGAERGPANAGFREVVERSPKQGKRGAQFVAAVAVSAEVV